MRYFVKPVDDQGAGRKPPGELARIDDEGRVEVFSSSLQQWVPAFETVQAKITARAGWSPLADADADAVAQALTAALPAALVATGYWVSMRPDYDHHLLVRSRDGHGLQGYAVTSGLWEDLPYRVSPSLSDPALWHPLTEAEVPGTKVWLHEQWDLKQAEEFDAQAPMLVDPELTEIALREGIVYYIVEILKRLPDGLAIGFQGPGLPPLRCGSGPLGPAGSWNFQVSYWVWGYPAGANDAVFDAFKALFDTWGWTYSYQPHRPDDRVVRAETSTDPKRSYHIVMYRTPHGGVSMTWTTPYFPGEHADRHPTGMRMPSIITKDGIQSWEPVYQ